MRNIPIHAVGAQSAGLPKWLLVLLMTSLLLTAWMALQEDESTETDLVADAVIKPNTKKNTATVQSMQMVEAPAIKPSIEDSLQASEDVLDNATFSNSADKRTSSALRVAKNNAGDLFKVQSWEVIKKVKPSPPPPPTAPAAPFVYMGKLEDTPKGTQVFLVHNNRVITVLKGEKIDAVWRLDAEDANNIRLTYLPLNLPQVLSKNAKPVLVPPRSPNSYQADSVQTGLVENNQ